MNIGSHLFHYRIEVICFHLFYYRIETICSHLFHSRIEVICSHLFHYRIDVTVVDGRVFHIAGGSPNMYLVVYIYIRLCEIQLVGVDTSY